MIIRFSSSISCSISVTNDIDSPQSSIIDDLESCKSVKELKQIHSYVIKTFPTLPNQTQQLVYTRIISTAATASKHSSDISYIHTLFSKLENPSIDLCNTFIRLFVDRSRDPLLALLFYRNLLVKGLVGDSFTYPYVFKACTLLCALKEGEQLHSHVVKNGFVSNLYVVNILIRFYGECSVMERAQKVFDGSPERDVVTWTTLIQGYVGIGCFEKAFEVFYEMCEAGVRADEMTMVVLLSACARLRDLSLGNKLHKYLHDHDIKFDVYVGNAFIDMYMKCGDACTAVKVFDEMPVKNVVSWNSIILGHIQQGEFKLAFNMFRKMQNQGVKHDEVTLVGVLNCCASLGALKQGEWVHSYIKQNHIKTHGFLGNALLDMYMKCGQIEKAYLVYNQTKHKDLYTYTSMIVGLAMNGNGQKALEIFSEMRKMGIMPNEVTYVGILMACSHAGLVKEGCNHFMEMTMVYNIKPQKVHYGCMVDLLGRAGLLIEAEDFIQRMNIEPDALVWGALLAACRVHGNVELGKRVMEILDNMDVEKDGAYSLMSNLYSSAYNWKDAIKLRKTMKARNIKKSSPGLSIIEVDGMAYEFRKGDKSHIKAKEIYMLLDIMWNHLTSTGVYLPD